MTQKVLKKEIFKKINDPLFLIKQNNIKNKNKKIIKIYQVYIHHLLIKIINQFQKQKQKVNL